MPKKNKESVAVPRQLLLKSVTEREQTKGVVDEDGDGKSGINGTGNHDSSCSGTIVT